MSSLLPEHFNGIAYRLATNWYPYLSVDEIARSPIRYLEIGALCGANLLSVANTFGIHPESELHCIDPWTRYTDYEESYDHNDNYGKFLSNMAQFKDRSKVFVHRGYSNALIPTFPDGYFDIIYIDGNHETRYVLEDAVLCFKKLKVGGYLILDDYSFPTVGKAIDSFVDCYAKHLEVLGHSDIQVITKKVSE